MRFSAAIAAAILQFTAVMAAPTDLESRDIEARDLEARASCTLTSFTNLATVKKSCTTITIGDLAVPAGSTLDLTGLSSGTKVIFAGEVTFGYKEWSGPLVSVSGTKITVTGSSGNLLNGNGAKWWDGKGGNGGKTKVSFPNPGTGAELTYLLHSPSSSPRTR
jgi:polygalacturonase